ncbi:type I restriction enzyme S subunit [Micrococcus yunnanensis]|nr:type I restriction enzyme S subunit [Micrococcus yunnanensis]
MVGRKGTAGSVTLIEGPAWATDTAYWAEPLDRVSLAFIRLLLEHADLPHVSAQTGVPGLNRDRAYEIPVVIPPMSQQRRIVDLMTAVDDAFESTTQLADTAEVLWWELTRDLETACDGLDLKPLGDISDIHGGLTKNKNDALRPDVIEAPYLRVANVYRRYLNLDEVSTIVASQKRIEGAILQPGDLLMNEGGDRDKLGRGAVWRGQIDGCTHQNHVFRVRVTDAEFVPEFVSAWANSYGKKWFDINASQTTGIASISKTTLSKFPVPVLPYADQERWADLLDTLTTHEWELRVQLKNLRDLRSNLLTALLSGKHEIPDVYDEIMEVSS